MSLITRRHEAEGRISEAVYSPCERYRYALTRQWQPKAPRLVYVMLNPSKATELANDPTIERCERRAAQLGYGAFRVVNLFALRETDPHRLKKSRRPVGPANTEQLHAAFSWADDILCAWGVHGTHRDQDKVVLPLLGASGKPALVLGETKDGHPRHPLYMPYTAVPYPWDMVRRAGGATRTVPST